MRYFFVLLFFIAPSFSHAFQVSNLEITGTNPYTFTFDVTGSNGQPYIGIAPSELQPQTSSDQLYLSSCDGTLLNDDTPPPYLWHLCYKNFTGDGAYSFNFTVREGYTAGAFGIELTDSIVSVDTWYTSLLWEINENNPTLTSFVGIGATAPIVDNISFINFDDINPSDMLASVRAGTTETTKKALPLLVFLGIPIGFLLVLLLIGMINNTLTPVKKETVRHGRRVINPSGTDFIEHSAKDLELKRNYGKTKE
jgi:hypothetical protein